MRIGEKETIDFLSVQPNVISSYACAQSDEICLINNLCWGILNSKNKSLLKLLGFISQTIELAS